MRFKANVVFMGRSEEKLRAMAEDAERWTRGTDEPWEVEAVGDAGLIVEGDAASEEAFVEQILLAWEEDGGVIDDVGEVVGR